ncbi:MAG TPA: hypothetical protein VH796_11440 [Nitrososphaeraceae archaeon]
MINLPATIWCIETPLQTPMDDYRKYSVRRILIPIPHQYFILPAADDPIILSHYILQLESRRNEIGVVLRDSDGRGSQRVSTNSTEEL